MLWSKTESSIFLCIWRNCCNTLQACGLAFYALPEIAGEIFDLRGKALNRAADVAKLMGTLCPFAFLQIFLSVLQTLQLVLFLCKLRLGSFLFGSELFEGFRFCHCT